jgi:hypothetical protein
MQDDINLKGLKDLAMSADSVHAVYIWAKLLNDDKVDIDESIISPSDRKATCKMLLETAAGMHYALAVEALATIRRRNGDINGAVDGWRRALSLCKFPTASYKLGIVYEHWDPCVADSGVEKDLNAALQCYSAAKDDLSVYRQNSDMIEGLIMTLCWDNKSQASFREDARRNHGAIARQLRQESCGGSSQENVSCE